MNYADVDNNIAVQGFEPNTAEHLCSPAERLPFADDGSDCSDGGNGESDCEDESDDGSSSHADASNVPTTDAVSVGTASPFVFRDKEHAARAFAALWQMRASGELVDVVLRIDGGAELACHRTVLAARSAYFRAMFTSGLAECRQDFVNLRGISLPVIRRLVRYMYTGVLRLTTASAPLMLAATDHLQLSTAKKACEAFMERHLDEGNCVEAYWLSARHACDGLRRRARDLMERHYATVCRGQAFVTLLTWKSVADLVASNELNVDDEAAVLQSVLRWLRHDAPSRRAHADSLLRLVRFKLLDADTLERLLNDEDDLLRSAKAGLSLMRKARKFLKQHDSAREERLRLFRVGMIKPAHCLLLIGGSDRSLQQSPVINCYNPLTRESYYIRSFINPNISRGYYEVVDAAALVTSDNRLFVAGGNYIFIDTREGSDDDSMDEREEEQVRKDVFEYDPDRNSWNPMTPMLFARSNFAMVELTERLYCFGGVSATLLPTSSVESFNVAENTWDYVTTMPANLVDLAAVVVGGKAYILGGRSGTTVQNAVFRFEPSPTGGGSWRQLCCMPTPRFNFATAVIQDEIYAAGGQTFVQSPRTVVRRALNVVEVYNVATNQWRLACPLPQPLYNAGLFLIHGDLYCFGTTEEQRSAHTVSRHNVVFRLSLSLSGASAAAEAGGWTRIERDLCCVRSYARAAYHLHTHKLSRIFRPDVDT